MSCPGCEKSTAGKCLLHINEGLMSTDQPGRWVWHRIPICIACGKPSDFTIIMPYGSAYDGDLLCWKCIRAFIDPVIERVRKERNA